MFVAPPPELIDKTNAIFLGTAANGDRPFPKPKSEYL
jgi:hypothetical protein